MPKQRSCGGCSLCCTLLPVDEVDKLAGQRCRHQCKAGCRVYQTPAQPYSCMVWSCRWLVGEDVGERPDRSHLVVDMMPDCIRLTPNGDPDNPYVIPALQVWCDPKYPDAHRNTQFRKWAAEFCEKNASVVIVRWSSAKGIALFPPWIASEWREYDSTVRPQFDPRTIEDKKALGLPIASPENVAAIVKDYKERNQ